MPRIAKCLNRTTRSIRRRAEVLKISWKTVRSHWPRAVTRNSSELRGWCTTEEKFLIRCEADWQKLMQLNAEVSKPVVSGLTPSQQFGECAS